MAALLPGCKPRIHKVVVDNQNSWIVKCRFCFTTVIYSIYRKDIKVLFKKVRGLKTFTSQLRLELSCKRQSQSLLLKAIEKNHEHKLGKCILKIKEIWITTKAAEGSLQLKITSPVH